MRRERGIEHGRVELNAGHSDDGGTVARAGHPVVLQRPSKTPLDAPSVGARGANGAGAVFVNQLVKWDEKLKADLDKMLDKAKAANERRYFDDDEDWLLFVSRFSFAESIVSSGCAGF
ncbi:hypothetical protein OPV22_033096 [Ensete ventricosum]|uniref:Uncharacterized protein n=1 Tax=Ensete ventricosum TaxID=4639 RepID=A0AAV8PZ51_ENSVE|nr:hypothetical protein OPV22_033096 [Ensete ventricosum]